jgi:hypothetical protein
VQRLFLTVLLLLDAVVFVFTRGITFLTGSHFVIVLTVTAALCLSVGKFVILKKLLKILYRKLQIIKNFHVRCP